MSNRLHSEALFLPFGGKRLEVRTHRVEGATRWIVLLHEALGSASYWRDFPEKLALATSCNVLLYARAGFGESEGPIDDRTPEYFQRHVSEVIPEMLAHFGISQPVMMGHSEGAGIAMMYAAASQDVAALVMEAPMVVPVAGTGQMIARMADTYPGSRLQASLKKYQRDADAVFYAWADWTATINPENFRPARFLEQVHCPVLLIQGGKDHFALEPQLEAIRSSLPEVRSVVFKDAGHLVHRDAADAMLASVAEFLADVLPG